MVKYHFITFATPDHMSFAQANVKTALEVGCFDTAKIYTMDDIDEYFKFKNSHIFKNNRGCGYWIWKPYIILKKLLEIDENDILCYNDSKYLWITNVRNMENDILSGKNIGVYKNKPNSGIHIEKEWSKFDAFALMNIYPGEYRETIKNTPQVWAGLIMFRKSFNPIRFIGEWLTYVQDQRIVTDSANIFGPNDHIFKENRHDQTILSLLLKKWNIPMNLLDKKYISDIRNI